MIKPTLNAAALSGAIAALPVSLIAEVAQNYLNRGKTADKINKNIKPESFESQNNNHYSNVNVSNRNPMLLSQYFSYGMAAGSFYPIYRSFFPQKMSGRSRIYLGASYGFLVWYSMHKEWFPKPEASAETSKKRVTKDMLQLGAHMLWGTALGFCYEILRQNPIKKEKNKKDVLLSEPTVKAPNIHEQRFFH